MSPVHKLQIVMIKKLFLKWKAFYDSSAERNQISLLFAFEILKGDMKDAAIA